MSRPDRSASLAIASFGTIANIAFATQVLTAWHSFKWEPESEWEASVGKWRIDGLKIIWVLLSTYFVSAAMVCSTGFVGIVKVFVLLVYCTLLPLSPSPNCRINRRLCGFIVIIPS